MKKNERHALIKKGVSEIATLLAQKKQEMAKLHLEMKVGKVRNSKTLKNIRRDIAQLLTMQQEQTLLNQLQSKVKA